LLGIIIEDEIIALLQFSLLEHCLLISATLDVVAIYLLEGAMICY